jgi:hypothetical protein
MARSKKQLIGYWLTEDGGRVWVYKAGRSYWISHGSGEHLCHPSIRSVDDTQREALLVFHVSPTEFHHAG